MSFLRCDPTVFVIEDRYEIILYFKESGVVCLEVNGKRYYEENSGVLSSEKCFLKISVPQRELNIAKKYNIVYRKTIDRKAYFSELEDEVVETYNFKPLEKTKDITIYHIADVHYNFKNALNAAKYNTSPDLYILNGDIGEVETDDNYYEVCEFCGQVARGEIPMVFARGNHDTRGKLAEDYIKYFPNIKGKTYYTFEFGIIHGLVLDCGEDKIDSVPNYGGVNIFHHFRLEETEFLERLEPNTDDGKIFMVVSHICPYMTTFERGNGADIERDVYAKWSKELERINAKFMLCGHYHKAFILLSDDERNIIEHKLPVIVGSSYDYETIDFQGAQLVLNKDNVNVKFTDEKCKVVGEYDIRI